MGNKPNMYEELGFMIIIATLHTAVLYCTLNICRETTLILQNTRK